MITTFTQHKSMLHTAFRANAIFSGISGLAFLLFSRPLAEWIGVPNPAALIIIGAALLPWELFLFRAAAQPEISPNTAKFVIAGDLLWVVASIALLLGDWVPFTVPGKWFVAAIADVILGFAVWQYFAYRRQA